MCLITTRKDPFIAEEDLMVYKLLGCVDGKYYTPYQGCDVELNSMLYPDENVEVSGNKRVGIEAGYIHSYIIHKYGEYCKPFKAYIPKGSKYYIDINSKEVCSDKLFITDIELNQRWYLMKAFLPLLKEIDSKGISAGWLVKPDKTFISPLSYNGEEIIGIVGHCEGDKKYIISLDHFSLNYGKEVNYNFPISSLYLEQTLNGKEMTKPNKNCYAFDVALAYSTPGTNPGDWYVPAIGELYKVFDNNILEINIVLALIGKSPIIDYYLSSSEYSQFVYYSFGPVFGAATPKSKENFTTTYFFLQL